MRAWLKAAACPYFHYVSTCRMPSARGGASEALETRSARHAVVDETLCVYGVTGLRVADASVAPQIPCAPTQAMSYMIGHRAADLILALK